MTRTTKVALVALITLLLGFTSPALANELEMTSEPGDVVSFDEPLVAQDVEQVDGSYQIDQDLQLDQEAQVSSDFDGEAIVAQAGSVSGICGTCRWDIDANGKLTIAPANSSSGVLPSSDEVFKNRKTSTGWGWP